MALRKEFKYTKFTENRSLEEAEMIHNQRIKDALDIYSRYHDSFIERDCPICGSSIYSNMEKFIDKYDIAKCNICASFFVNPVPDIEGLKDYYNNSECNQMLNQVYNKRKQKSNDFIIDGRVIRVAEYLKDLKGEKSIKILEIGCNSGSFLSKLRKYVEENLKLEGVEYYGIDIDKNAIMKNQDSGINLSHSSVEEFVENNSETYDIILHFELIEHLIDPYNFMLSTRQLLRDKGVVIFSTNNYCGLEMVASDYNSYRLIAHNIFPPMHLNAFSIMNVTHFAIRCSFAVLDIQTPGKLDMDMITLTKDHIKDDVFYELAGLDEDVKGLLQELISKLKVSGHMQCTLRKI